MSALAAFNQGGTLLLVSDRPLIACHVNLACQVDFVCPIGGATAGGNRNLSRTAPQKVSARSQGINIFASGKMKDRTLAFYKKREGLSSNFRF